jgi:ribosomal protein S18 acetylase RimI-like enzyme
VTPAAGSGTVVIGALEPEQWRELRSIRIEMLEDEPTAFLERSADARRLLDVAWRRRAEALSVEGRSRAFYARDDGAWAGFVAVTATSSEPLALVHAMYVREANRGGDPSVAGLLLAAARSWATEQGGRKGLRLYVLEANPAARRCYEKAGFAETGARRPYRFDAGLTELELTWRPPS